MTSAIRIIIAPPIRLVHRLLDNHRREVWGDFGMGVVGSRAVHRRHCVGGGTPANFGRRRGRRGVGGKNIFSKIPEKNYFLSSNFSDDLFSHRKLQQNNNGIGGAPTNNLHPPPPPP